MAVESFDMTETIDRTDALLADATDVAPAEDRAYFLPFLAFFFLSSFFFEDFLASFFFAFFLSSFFAAFLAMNPSSGQVNKT
jgi:hypothetical protein